MRCSVLMARESEKRQKRQTSLGREGGSPYVLSLSLSQSTTFSLSPYHFLLYNITNLTSLSVLSTLVLLSLFSLSIFESSSSSSFPKSLYLFATMFEENFMGFDGDFSRGRASDRRLPPPRDFGGCPDTNPFLKSYDTKSDDVMGLCKKLNGMGISCDMSIWTRPGPIRVDPADFGSRRTLPEFPDGASRFRGDYSPPQAFLRSTTSSHGADLSFLGLQDSFYPNGLREMMALKTHRDALLDHINRPIKRSSPCLGNDALMFERNRVSDLDYPHDSLRGVSLGGGRNRASLSYGKMRSDLPLDLASMVNIYGSVNLMGKDQIGCRFLQKLVDEGLFVDALFLEIINHVVELSMDPFGNYLVQKLLEACDEDQRTTMVSVLTSRPTELLKICLNNYG